MRIILAQKKSCNLKSDILHSAVSSWLILWIEWLDIAWWLKQSKSRFWREPFFCFFVVLSFDHFLLPFLRRVTIKINHLFQFKFFVGQPTGARGFLPLWISASNDSFLFLLIMLTLIPSLWYTVKVRTTKLELRVGFDF